MDAPARLVETGLFARMRKPIMLGELTVVWAEAVYVGSLGVIAYAALLSLVGHLMVA